MLRADAPCLVEFDGDIDPDHLDGLVEADSARARTSKELEEEFTVLKSEWDRTDSIPESAAGANDDGIVLYPNVNLAVEMINLLPAQRAYVANVDVIMTDRSMGDKALEIIQQ